MDNSSKAEVNFTDTPQELIEKIFRNLTATDLCHVALCNRIFREVTNQDILWRPLCRKQGWERYGTICDLRKEPPFKRISQDQKTGEGGAPTYPAADAVVTGSDWPGLVDTCKWKEVYMKARHLEENWRNQRFYQISLEYCFPDQSLYSLTAEASCLAVSFRHGTLEIWDMSSGKRKRRIELHEVVPSPLSRPDALKMKDGIIAAGCMDGKIRTYSAQTGEQLQVISGHRLAVSHLFFDGDTIVSAAQPLDRGRNEYAESDIRVWNVANGASRCILHSGLEATNLIHLDYKEKIVAGAYSNNTIRIWDARNGSCIQQIVSDMNKMTFCHLRDGIVIGASKDLIVKIWELQSGECIKTFDVLPDRPADDQVYSWLSLNGFGEEAYYKFMDGLLIVGTVYSGFHILNLDGERILTCGECEVRPVYLKGNKLLTWNYALDAWWYELRIMDPVECVDGKVRGSSKTKVTQKVGHSNVGLAWMSDTKMCFQRTLMVPAYFHEICVRHYW